MNISNFDDLLRAARRQPEPQRLLFVFAQAVVFVASLPGRNGRAPSSEESDRSLQRMVESIKAGSIGSFIPFDRRGEPVLLS